MRQFYGRLEKMRSFAGKTHVHKNPRFGGGYFGFGGVGGADFVFMGARIFLIMGGGVGPFVGWGGGVQVLICVSPCSCSKMLL